MQNQTLHSIINRNPSPGPWSEGDNIPWNEPGFSERMLKEHLTQEHNAASRRFEKIDRHVSWIHKERFNGQPSKLLDLGCGPGLYTSRLAKMGHQVTGIDYSPASIAYARAQAAKLGQKITYIQGDIREAAYGGPFDHAMQIFGETNVFRPGDIRKILGKIHTALKPGGQVTLEVHTFEVIQKLGNTASSWYAAESGLFSPQPHLVLTEYFWNADQNVATVRHYAVEADTGNVLRYAQSLQAYTDEEYRSLLAESGFDEIQFFPSLTGVPDPEQEDFFVIGAVKT